MQFDQEKLSPQVISELQGQLKILGFYRGYVDGVIGEQTKQAIRKFQGMRGLPTTGTLDTQTIEFLTKAVPLETSESIQSNQQEEQIHYEPELYTDEEFISEASQEVINKERFLLKKQGNTEIYAHHTNVPWEQPFDALIIPTGRAAMFDATFAASFLASLYPTVSSELQATLQNVRSAERPDGISPDQPLLIPLPPEIGKERYVIAITVQDTSKQVNLKNVSIATKSIINVAEKRKLKRLVIPLLGTGGYGLSTYKVAALMLRTIVENRLKLSNISEITIAHNQEAVIERVKRAAQDALVDPGFLAQSPQNDLAEGKDLLNIESEVYALAEVLLMRNLEPPVAVGILGGWGSGKSHIMHLMQQRMTQIRSEPVSPEAAWSDFKETENTHPYPYVGHIYQIKFDAWTYARSNLWASLMEAIFFELNRQLKLEKQLQEAGFSPNEGGNVWEALNDMSDCEREELLAVQRDSNDFEALQKASKNIEQLLWLGLEASRKKEKELLEAKKAELEQAEKALDDKISSIENFVEREVKPPIIKSAAVDQFTSKFLKDFVGQSFRDLEKTIDTQLKELNSSESIEELRMNIEAELKIFRDERLVTPRSIWNWVSTNWKLVIFFLISLLATFILIPLALKTLNEGFIPKLAAILVPLIPSVVSTYQLMKKWYADISKVVLKFNDYQAEVNKLAEDKQKEFTQKRQQVREAQLNAPEVKQLQAKIEVLKTDIENQSHRVKEIEDISLQDFVSTQLDQGLYGKRLGLMQQVKQDLATLTERLLPPKKINGQNQEQLDHLCKLFPRGPARVVLFIDDLDRCPPRRVVEVLEAVQLLVKTRLFVVILAIDERYIARALEKVYSGVLSRRGRPSGLDYIEKIIQIPYRVRPVATTALQTYLSAQMELAEALEETQEVEETFNSNPEVTDSSTSRTVEPVIRPDEEFEGDLGDNPSREDDGETVFLEPLPPQVVKFTKEEFDIVHECCRHVDLSPRTLKRLINVYKLFKIVWFRSSSLRDMQQEPKVQKAIVAFLALSGRYPNLMRGVFEEIDMCFEEGRSLDITFSACFEKCKTASHDSYLNREWDKLLHDVRALKLTDVTLEQLGLETFNMIRSFCFVGDIGYDPNDFAATSHSSNSQIGNAPSQSANRASLNDEFSEYPEF